MLYIERDAQGSVVGVYTVAQPGRTSETVADDHADVAAFKARKPKPPADPVAALAARVDTLESEVAALTKG